MHAAGSRIRSRLGVMLMFAALIGGAVALYEAASTSSSHAESSGDAAAMPAQKVEVLTIKEQPLRNWASFSGRLWAVDYVEVRPRVSGTLQDVLFEEGAIVKKGEPLYVIDPRPFEAAVAHAKAELQSARSRVELAKVELKRSEGLVKQKYVSESVYDERKNDYKVALAAVEAAEARLQKASLDLEYAHIDAPVSGRISRAEITEGNVVEAGSSAPVLTTIVSNEEIYADFEVDEQTYLRFIRQTNRDNGGVSSMPVHLSLVGDKTVYEGYIHSFDNRIDPRSGTIRARAVFKNTDGALMPGMFANVKLGAPQEVTTIVVPERAVGTDQDKKFVLVVDEKNTVNYREVRLGNSQNGERIVLDGLAAGDRIIVNGLMRVRPGMEVAPEEITVHAANARGAETHEEVTQ